MPTQPARRVRSSRARQKVEARQGQAQTREALRRTQEQFGQLVDHIREVFFIYEVDPVRVAYLSPAYEEIWNRPRQEAYDRPEAWMETILPDDRARVLTFYERSMRGTPGDEEYRIVRPDGAIRWIRGRTFPVQNAKGKFYRLVGIAEDITEFKRIEQTLMESLEHARKAHEQLAVALKEVEERTRERAMLTELVDMLESCPSLEEAYAVSGTMLGRFFGSRSGALAVTSPSRDTVRVVAAWGAHPVTDQVFAPDDCWALRRGKMHVAQALGASITCTHVRSAKLAEHVCVPLAAQGETLGVLCVAEPPELLAASAKGSPGGMDTLIRQASAAGERLSLALANLRLREILRSQSIRDPLTNLFNRRYMEESADRELHRATRNREPVAFLMLDIDAFKRFNDTFGHQAGDTFLRAVGAFLRERTRGVDIACRYGGEELLLVLPGASGEEARRRAEDWRREFKHITVQHAGQALGNVTLSIGVSVFPDHGATLETLIDAADRALYRAKAEGRDRVVVTVPAQTPQPAGHEGSGS